MPESSRIHVFAYGSNLCVRRISTRVECLEIVDVASVSGYQLRFNKRGRDGSAKANAHYTGDVDHVVWGIVYALDVRDKERLDRIEGLGRDYFESVVDVRAARGSRLQATLYCANPELTEDGIAPYEWYHRFCIEGARAHGLPKDYVEQIEKIDAVADPDRTRHERESAILDFPPDT